MMPIEDTWDPNWTFSDLLKDSVRRNPAVPWLLVCFHLQEEPGTDPAAGDDESEDFVDAFLSLHFHIFLGVYPFLTLQS